MPNTVVESGNAEVSEAFVILGLTEESMLKTNMCCKLPQRFKRGYVNLTRAIHCSLINTSPKIVLRFYSYFFFCEVGCWMIGSLKLIYRRLHSVRSFVLVGRSFL